MNQKCNQKNQVGLFLFHLQLMHSRQRYAWQQQAENNADGKSSVRKKQNRHGDKKYAKEKRKNIRELVQEDVKINRDRMNEEFGGINGEEKFLKFIKSGEEPLDRVKHIIIFTDGLIIPKENPDAADDFGKFVELFLDGGLKKVLKYVRDLERDDPECWKYPRYKQYDDIAAISISF